MNHLFRSLLLATFLVTGVATAAERRPNIVFILTDDFGCGDLTCYGPEGLGVPTPNIDRIARNGARFTQYYSAAPICSPSRAALLSGRFPSELRLNSYLQARAGNANCDQNDFLDPPAAATLPRALQSAGYKTAHFGKWHLGGGRDVDNAPKIREYGFDEYASTWESPEPHPDLGVKYPPWEKDEEPNQVTRHKRTEYMVNRTLDFLKRHKDSPCFVNLWPDDTHTPHRPSPEMASKYGASDDDSKTPRKNMSAVLEEYDRQIGRLLDGIREAGLEKETIVIFTADNGPAPPLDHVRTNGQRGMKLSLYEGGIRVPFLVQWPGKVPAGHVDDITIVSATDMAPTLGKLAGVTFPADVAATFDGDDMSKVLLGEKTKRTRPLLWEYGRKRKGYGYPGLASDKSPNVAIRDGDWKLLVNDDGTSVELYRIPDDFREERNVAGENAAVADDLKRRALEWRKALPGRSHPIPPKEEATESDGKSTSPSTTSSTPGGKKPNVIVIVSDDHGYADLGCQGAKDIKTPHLDELAANGVRFTQGYVTAPLCGPSRAGLLTGRYQTRFGFEVNPGPDPAPNFGLPTGQRTLANYLKEAGYATGAVGKWHLGLRDGCRPVQRGFDEYFGFLHGAHSYFPGNRELPFNSIRRNDTPVSETRYLTYAFNDEAVKFVDRNRDRSFFLYLAYNAIHDPMEEAPGLAKRFPHITDPKRLTMATMLAALDDGVGQIVERLRKHKIEENTLIFFVSDNGGPTGGNTSRNTPLSGQKSRMLEGGIRVPFIVQWKGVLPAGKTYDEPVITLDIFPTALAAAGSKSSPEAEFDGVNLLPFLKGEAKGVPHDQLFWRMGEQWAARIGDWKLVRSGSKEPKLHNLAEDISESRDLLSEKPDKAKELQAAYDEWDKDNIEALWQDSRDSRPKGSQQGKKAQARKRRNGS